jgi:polyphosphate kinase 2 (PPK2 family)
VAKKQVRDLLRAQPHDGRFRMADIDAASTPGLKSRKQLKRDLKRYKGKLFNLQERLFAEQKRSMLLVLQGMDTSGKDGTITHVIGNLNPEGVLISTFKQPTPEERRHGFLWRIRKRLPETGYVGIFNRSHYEDVLIARVHDLAKPVVIERRYGVINRFERELVRGGTAVVKICLHISYDEQRRRLIPANDKDYRNWAISRILSETFEQMNPQYPHPKLDIPRLMKRLQA